MVASARGTTYAYLGVLAPFARGGGCMREVAALVPRIIGEKCRFCASARLTSW